MLEAASGQATGTIDGSSVYDPSGALVPAGVVTATNQGTNQSRQVVADNTGKFTFTFLPVGSYTAVVAKDGFSKSTTTDIVLQANTTVQVNAQAAADHPDRLDIVTASVGTDPRYALQTRKATGFYKVPSLKGVCYRGPFEHTVGWHSGRLVRPGSALHGIHHHWLFRSGRAPARREGSRVWDQAYTGREERAHRLPPYAVRR